MRSKGLAIIGLLVAASMVLAACGTATPETIIQTVIVEGTPQVVEVTAAAPAGPKVLHVNTGGSGDVPTLDPGVAEDTTSITIIQNSNIGLTHLLETDAKLYPGMAEIVGHLRGRADLHLPPAPRHPVGQVGRDRGGEGPELPG